MKNKITFILKSLFVLFLCIVIVYIYLAHQRRTNYQKIIEQQVKPYKEKIENNPADMNAWNKLGRTYYSYGKHKEAIRIYKEAIQVNPENFKAYLNLSGVYERLGKNKEQLKIIDKAISIDSEREEAWIFKGFSLQHLERYEEAITAFKQGINLNPNNPKLMIPLLQMGQCYDKLGNYQEAKKAFNESIKNSQKALHRSPDNVLTYLNMGECFIGLKDYEKAAKAFKEVISTNPNWVRAHYGLGISQLFLHNKKAAMQEYNFLKTHDKKLARKLFSKIQDLQN